jgi:hypothetical protein
MSLGHHHAAQTGSSGLGSNGGITVNKAIRTVRTMSISKPNR